MPLLHLAFAPALVFLAACTNDAGLSDRLEQLAANKVGRFVDIGIATPFAWDEMTGFGPYYPKEHACKELNLSAWGCFWLSYPKPDDAAPSLIAFLNGGELVATAQIPRCGVHVFRSSRNKTPRTAKFVAYRDEAHCKEGLLVLKQV